MSFSLIYIFDKWVMMGRKLLPINVVSNIVMDIMSLVFDFSMSSPAWGKKQDVFLTLFFFFTREALGVLRIFLSQLFGTQPTRLNSFK